MYGNAVPKRFSFISSNWRGEPLADYQTIVSLIARTTTAQGLTVQCRLDRRRYAVGKRVSDDELAALQNGFQPCLVGHPILML